jgi:two-component system, response regulator PdtaR
MGVPKKVLVVEDEAISVLHLELEFSKMGFEVCKPVVTGEEAVKVALRDSPDIIIMDIHLPGKMDGIEAAKAIRAVRRIPVIFVTGFDDENIRKSAMLLGPEGYYTKPLSSTALSEILRIISRVGKEG